MKKILGILLIGMILFAGCIQNQTVPSAVSSAPQQTNKSPIAEPQPTKTYACPDGSIVTALADCPKSKCIDGTEYGHCSIQKPKFCQEGQLNDKATVCGCQTGYVASEESCTKEANNCDDGTTYGSCSLNKPKYCNNGTLVDDVVKCGNQTAADVNKCSDGTPKLACSITKPYFCDTNLNIVEKASRCSCPLGYDMSQDTCVKRCSDGTRSGLCSSSKPKECLDGTLSDNPAKCGCPEGYKLDASGKNCEVWVKTSEDLWVENSVEQNHYLQLENFGVTVVRAGYYTQKYFGQEQKYIRLDIKVTNLDSDPHYFFGSNMALVDSDKNQYDYEYSGTFESGLFHSGVKRSGSVLFKVTGAEPSYVTLNIEDGYDSHFNTLVKSVGVNLKK